MKIGRNDLCPCGSGKKYKKCCLNKTVEDPRVKYESAKNSLFSSGELKRMIYLTNTEILHSNMEEVIENDGYNEYLHLIEQFRSNKRFKIWNEKKDYGTFYPFYEMLFLNSDIDSIIGDYPILADANFNTSIDLVEMDCWLKKEDHDIDKAIKRLSQIDEYLYKNDWNSLDTNTIIEFLKSIGIKEGLSLDT